MASVGRAVPMGGQEVARAQLAGAEAFRNVCVHCAAHLSAGSLLPSLVAATKPLLEGGARLVLGDGSPLGLDARVALAEGLGRLIAVRGATDTEAAEAALFALVSVPAAALNALLAQARASSGARAPAELCGAVCLELTLISSSIRFCDSDTTRWLSRISGAAATSALACPPNPANALIRVVEKLWPLLEQVPSACASDTGAADALLDVLTKAIICAKHLLVPQLPQVLDLATHAFAATRALGALTLIKVTVEVHGPSLHTPAAAPGGGGQPAVPQVCEALNTALSRVISLSCAAVLTGQHPIHTLNCTPPPSPSGVSTGESAEPEPQLLNDFFEMVHRVLVFSPLTLFALAGDAGAASPGSLGQLLRAAARCVTHQEFTHTRAVISCLCLFIERAAERSRVSQPVAHNLDHAGPGIMGACVLGLVVMSPDNLVEHQIELLRVLFDACPNQAPQWLSFALQLEPVQAATAGGAGGADVIALFHQLMAYQPRLEHDAIAREFAQMCRKKAGAGGNGLRRFIPPLAPVQ